MTLKKSDFHQKPEREAIAIIGIGCRFPGGITNPDSFWTFLKTRGDAITNVPLDRWNTEAYYDPNPNKAGKIKSKKGGFLSQIDKFDANFFNIFPNEAQRIDPQQRLLLEVSYEAMEDAGIPLTKISGTKTGVYMGVFMNDYWDIQSSSDHKENISPQVPMGVSLTAIANRLSYVFNLKGPSMTIDTACSSSLVSVHLACQSILNGEIDLALAGGVNLIIRPESSIMMSKGNFLSPDGYCKSFDSRANGYVRSEGSGVIVLKLLSKAIEDGDQVYAVIKGSAVNQDGFTEDGFTVPSALAQEEMLRTAYQNAGINPQDVSYVEAHGTGTPVGDPIETKAFGQVIGEGRSDNNPCVIGSVKSNIGHLEAAAGIAGLIKLALILKNREIPANLHFVKPNPKIPFDKYKLRVAINHETIEKEGNIYGGVNSFGAGGTNAHVVMESYDMVMDKVSPKKANESAYLFSVSGKTKEALADNIKDYISFLSQTSETIKDICFTSLVRKSQLEHKLTITARSISELLECLSAYLNDETRAQMIYSVTEKKLNPKIGFIYSGQGPQWYAMGQQLMEKSEVFQGVILRIEEIFKKISGWSLIEEMSKDEATSNISDTRIAQPAIMAIQIALTELWKSWGLNADGYVGHSIGEVAAAYASGALSIEQAVEVIFHRSRGQNKATGKGKMLAVGLSHKETLVAIRGYEKQISVAAVNGPNMVALAGDSEPLEVINIQMQSKDVFTRYLKVNVPFHSHHMEPLKEELIDSLRHLAPSKTDTPLYSTVTGKLENGEHLVSDYWYANVRETVLFTDAIQKMIDDGYDTFIEIAPHPILTVGVNELLVSNKVRHGIVVPSLRRGFDEEFTMQLSLGHLHNHGYKVNWVKFFGENSHFVKLPSYRWQHQSYWFETQLHLQKRLGNIQFPFIENNQKSAVGDSNEVWNANLNKSKHLFLEDHKVEGTIIFPGTGHLELALEVAKARDQNNFAYLEDINLEAALFLPEEGEAPDVRLEITNDETYYTICSKPKYSDDNAWIKHSQGKIAYNSNSETLKQFPIDEARKRINEPISVSDFYFELKEGGLNYGEAFRCIQKIWTANTEILGALSLPKSLEYEAPLFYFHPAFLDACLHTLFAARKSSSDEKRGIYLPTHIDGYYFYQKPSNNLWVHIKVNETSAEYLKGDYSIVNQDGAMVAEIKGLTCKYIEGSRKEHKNELYKGMYEYEWLDATDVVANLDRDTGSNSYLIFGDSAGRYMQIVELLSVYEAKFFIILQGDSYVMQHSNVMTIDSKQSEDISKLFKYLNVLQIKFDKIVSFWALDFETAIEPNSKQMQQQQDAFTLVNIQLLKAFASLDVEPTIYLLHQHLEKIVSTDKLQVSQSSLVGMARVMMNEFPFISLTMLGLGSEIESSDWNTMATILSKNPKKHNRELAIRKQNIYQRKLKPVVEQESENKYAQSLPALGSRFKVTVDEPGIIDSIKFRQTALKQLSENEVEIKVYAAGLNFKDVMNVMGLLSDEAVSGGVAGNKLGLECSGVITAVGKKVSEFSIGDEVLAWASESFAGYTVANVNCVVHKPNFLSFEQAASITVAFLTAHYSLDYLGRMSRGERVLIHSATGGVGLAAIQLAKHKGLEIFATAGNEAKRKFLQEMGIKHIYDSRSLDFADKIKEATNGGGVDIVLNSLSGKAIAQSIRCLAPFGRFIEIGKTDIYRDAKLALKRFGNNLSYYAVDLDRLMLQKPNLGKQLFNEVAQMLHAGVIKTQYLNPYPIQQLSDAISQLSKGTHIGKLVVSMNSDLISILPSKELELSSEGTYLVTGGASGFGLELAVWLSQKGARNLVLVSRSGAKTDYDKQTIKSMEQNGIKVVLMSADIAKHEEVQKIIHQISVEMPSLKGIIHSAAVLKDATLKNIDQEKFNTVYHPKVMGAWNLHLATHGIKLDFFLMLSSISSIIGLPGQANYSAANNFLDKLAEYRQQNSLAACSINLGVLGNYAGMSKDGEHVIKVLENQGWNTLSLNQVTAKIENVLLQQPAYRMAANLDWKKFKDFFAHLQSDYRFEEIIKGESDSKIIGNMGGSSLSEQIMQLEKAERPIVLQNKILESLAKILGTSTDKLDVKTSVSYIGLDSLMLNQLRNWIQQKLEINFPLMRIAKGPSIEELSEQLIVELEKQANSTQSANSDISGIGLEEDIEVVNNWLIKRKHSSVDEVKLRIFCIHPVGAGASMFSHFMYNSPNGTEVMAFQLPGRENRANETFFEDVNLLVAEMAKAIHTYLDRPYIIMGHSFGGILGYELIRFLQKYMQSSPIHLFISGTIAPHLTKKWKERDVISQTAIFSNSEERLLSLMSYIDDVEFLKKILPIMRKDMPLIMNYLYQETEKLKIPITAYAADQDEVVHAHEVAQWAEQTDASFELEVVPGDHWFLSRNREQILNKLSEVAMLEYSI